MIEHNYYQLFELELYADAVTVKKKYRELAKLYHPDRNPETAGADEYFKIVTQGYNILSEPDQKLVYDLNLRNVLENKATHSHANESYYKKQSEAASFKQKMHDRRQHFKDKIQNQFNRNEKILSHKLRFVMAVLLFLSGLLIAYNNWYINLLNQKLLYVVIGGFMFGTGNYFIADNIYKRKQFYLTLKEGADFLNVKGPVRQFTLVLCIVPVVFIIGMYQMKKFQLEYFFDYTYPTEIKNQGGRIYYKYNVDGEDILRFNDFNFYNPIFSRQSFRVKFSRLNPIISELVYVGNQSNVIDKESIDFIE